MPLSFLKKNDVVEIINPASASTFDEIEKIKNFIKKIGLKPNIFFQKELSLKKAISHEFASFAAEKRFEQFKKAIESDSKIIWCARGGYGCAEILSFLTQLEKPKTSKIFIGFSDISSLNKILIDDWNWQVVSAPMLAQIVLNKVSSKSTSTITDFIFGKKIELKYQLKPIISSSKKISAVTTGGCLSVVAGQFGTKNQINWQDKILFLEDEGEDGERLDRYFYQLVQIIVEQKKYPQAIVLGNFLQGNLHGTPKAKNINLAIKKLGENLLAQKLKIALYQEKSKVLGHSKNMLPLVLGAEAKITADNFLLQKLE
ncbi:MAG: LD-carboxypeptidase [Rickettsiales bacterium]|nr:LD-carboxypeptidase [Rickettsiales bacterium]